MPERTKPVSVALTIDLIKSVDQVGETAGLSRSAITRIALDEFLRQHGVAKESP